MRSGGAAFVGPPACSLRCVCADDNKASCLKLAFPLCRLLLAPPRAPKVPATKDSSKVSPVVAPRAAVPAGSKSSCKNGSKGGRK